jgi:hypothetical protein
VPTFVGASSATCLPLAVGASLPDSGGRRSGGGPADENGSAQADHRHQVLTRTKSKSVTPSSPSTPRNRSWGSSMPPAARQRKERPSRPRGGGRRQEPADRRVEAGGVDSARWVVCILWRRCSRSDFCCSWELRMVQAAVRLLDLGLGAIHGGIASRSRPWLNSLAALTVSMPACPV